jgi:hypothetical protein
LKETPLTGVFLFQQLEHDVEEACPELRVKYLKLILFLLVVVFHYGKEVVRILKSATLVESMLIFLFLLSNLSGAVAFFALFIII